MSTPTTPVRYSEGPHATRLEDIFEALDRIEARLDAQAEAHQLNRVSVSKMYRKVADKP